MKKTNDGIVYVVDDDPQVLKVLTMLISAVGYQVKTYTTAEELIEASDQFGQSPECIVLDLCLPGMDGVNFQQWLKDECIEIPIIFISGFGDIPTAVEVMKLGAIDFLEKPFKRIELLRQVHAALDKQTDQLARQKQSQDISERLTLLTEREREILKWMVAGETIKEIASRFEIGTRTVSKHQIRILTKMEVDNVVELVHLMQNMD